MAVDRPSIDHPMAVVRPFDESVFQEDRNEQTARLRASQLLRSELMRRSQADLRIAVTS